MTLIRRARLQTMAACARCTIKRFPAGSYAIKIAGINHFFNQHAGIGKGCCTKSFHEARVQVISAELNTFLKTSFDWGKRKESDCAIVRPLGRFYCSSLNAWSYTSRRCESLELVKKSCSISDKGVNHQGDADNTKDSTKYTQRHMDMK